MRWFGAKRREALELAEIEALLRVWLGSPIVAGTITADKIVAGTIEAKEMVVADRGLAAR